jgi:hypothetical protein
MIPRDPALAGELREKLIAFDRDQIALPGIRLRGNLDCLLAQIVDSVRRVRYVEVIRDKHLSEIYADQNSRFFDPLKAASWRRQQGEIEEAFWLVFLLTHFGKNKFTGWQLMQGVYRGGDPERPWNWAHITQNFDAFRHWLQQNKDGLKTLGHFGNHRKYQSLDAYSPTGTGTAMGAYMEWVESAGGHVALMQRFIGENDGDPKRAFHALYKSMEQVVSFGRMGKFDYLTMVGKLGLAGIEPDSTYMTGATGARSGANLLFVGTNRSNLPLDQLEANLNGLESDLRLFFGMQVLEDALCNWHKSPGQYQYFGG